MHRLYVIEKITNKVKNTSKTEEYYWPIEGNTDIEIKQNIMHTIIEAFPCIANSIKEVHINFADLGDGFWGEVGGIEDRDDKCINTTIMFFSRKVEEPLGDEPTPEEEMKWKYERTMERLLKTDEELDPVTAGAIRHMEYEMVQSEFVLGNFIQKKYDCNAIDDMILYADDKDIMCRIHELYEEKYPDLQDSEEKMYLDRVLSANEWIILLYNAIMLELAIDGEDSVKEIMGEEDWKFFKTLYDEVNGNIIY